MSIDRDTYCYATTWLYSDGTTAQELIAGRARVHSIVGHGRVTTASNDSRSLILRNGSASGSVLYQSVFPSASTFGFLVVGYEPTTQVNMGGNGILFDESVWIDWSASGVPGQYYPLDLVTVFYS